MDTDDATLTLNCYDLSVSKSAATSYTRTWNWTIDKSVTPDAWDLFLGETGTSEYTVTVDKGSYTDSAWAVTGTIHIVNNHPTRAADLTSVSDEVSTGISGTVDCGGVTSVPAGGSIDCTYSADLPDATDRTNTATATQQLYNFDETGSATTDGTKDYTGNADVTFGEPDQRGRHLDQRHGLERRIVGSGQR